MSKFQGLWICLTLFLATVNGINSTGEESMGQPPKDSSSVVKTKIQLPIEPTILPPPTTTTSTTTTKTTTSTTPATTTTAKTTAVTPTPPPPAPNTTTSTTMAPTPEPKTTTVGPVTTPAPAPEPKMGQWVVNGTKGPCIVVKMAVQFNVSYVTSENKTMWKELTLPTDNSTIASGNCSAKEQTLNLTWHNDDSLMIHFIKNETTGHYMMHHIQVSLGSHEFPNDQSNATVQFIHEVDQFPTKLSNSYRCMRLQTLNLTRSDSNQTSGWLKLSDLQFQAFKSDNTTAFGLVQDCSADVPDVVPIAVGCALTVLVIIVLVAYLVGRRRSQARGYLSM